MGDNSEAARARAEARFEKIQKATQESAAVWAQYEASCQAVRDRTALLKEMRLAKEAREAAAVVETAVPKRKRRVPAKV